MARQSRGVMLRSMAKGQRGRGEKAGGKAGKRGLGEGARKAISDAKALAEAGKHTEAAEAFSKLATIAAGRAKANIAAFLALRGASSLLENNDLPGAISAAREGIAHAEGISESKRVARFYAGFIQTLKKDHPDEAAELATEVKKRFGLKILPSPGEGTTANRAQRRSMPKACPGCGTPIDSKTVRFEDDGTADCPACGDTLH